MKSCEMMRSGSARQAVARSDSSFRWLIVVWFASGLFAFPSFVRAQEVAPFDWMGTWYVLVHYRDASQGDTETVAWEDAVWIFEKRGSRLQWTEYPIVLFDDEGRRFEELPSGRSSRVAEAWEPRPEEIAEIREGLQVNPRGMRAKSLRGDGKRGYRSAGTMNVDSASTIGYSETWEIRDPESLPEFVRKDVMGGGRAENLEGTTAYRSERILESGSLIEGSFERDAHQRGTFRMLRAGEIERTKPKKRRDGFE